MSVRNMTSDEAKKRAGLAFDKGEQRKREAKQRQDEQHKTELSTAAKIQRLRALRLARDIEIAAQVPEPVAEKPKRVKKPKVAVTTAE